LQLKLVEETHNMGLVLSICQLIHIASIVASWDITNLRVWAIGCDDGCLLLTGGHEQIHLSLDAIAFADLSVHKLDTVAGTGSKVRIEVFTIKCR
jgi:hypothetical protein